MNDTGYVRGPPPLPRQPPQRASSLQSSYGSSSQTNGKTHNANQPIQRGPVSPISPAITEYRQQSYTTNGMDSRQARYSHQGLPLQASSLPPTAYPPIYQDGYQQGPHSHTRQQAPTQGYQRQPYRQQQAPQPQKPKTPEDLLTSPFETPLPSQTTNIAPPPIPPNPQKDALLSALSQTLTQQIHATHASNLSALPPLRAQQAALTSTLNAINAEMSQLGGLEKLLSSNEAILHQAMRDADKVLDDAKRRKVPNVDEVLVAPTIVAGQLYASVAEERAIEESRAVLAKALDKGRIGGGVWAKVRWLVVARTKRTID